MSDYERKRQANIARNQAYMESLNLQPIIPADSSKPKAKRKIASNGPRRKSVRRQTQKKKAGYCTDPEVPVTVHNKEKANTKFAPNDVLVFHGDDDKPWLGFFISRPKADTVKVAWIQPEAEGKETERPWHVLQVMTTTKKSRPDTYIDSMPTDDVITAITGSYIIIHYIYIYC